MSVLEKHGAQAFHVSSPLYYEAGSGLSQDVTLLLSRQGAYNKGDACPVQRLANADQGVFIVEHKESCMWCEQGALKEDCRPLAAARVKKHQFALASGISPFGENDAPVAALITDLLRKGGVPCPWLPIQEEEYERNLPIPADLSEDGLRATRVLGFYFSEECVPLSGVTFPSRFGIGSLLDLSGRCLEQLDPPISSWKGITFGVGSEEFSLTELSSSLRIGVKQTAAATMFLLRQAQLLPDSSSKTSLSVCTRGTQRMQRRGKPSGRLLLETARFTPLLPCGE